MQHQLALIKIAVLFVCILLCAEDAAFAGDRSDDEIRELLIQQSIANYPGNCPCPYSLDRAGRRCGKRSAHSKQGGYAPLCYPEDASKEMIENYRSGT